MLRKNTIEAEERTHRAVTEVREFFHSRATWLAKSLNYRIYQKLF